MDKNENIGLLKTALVLTKTIFTFFIVSILIYLNFIDLKENNNNRTYLNILKDVATKYHASDLSFKNYELKRLDSLKEINPPMYIKHLKSRIALVNTLNAYGALINRSSKGDNTNKNNIILLMSNDSLRKKLKSNTNDILPILRDNVVTNYDNHEDYNINNALDIFDLYPQNEDVELLTAIDTLSLKLQCDSLHRKFVTKKGNFQTDSLTAISPFQRKGIKYTDNKYRPGDERFDKNGTGGPVSYTNEETGKNVKPYEKSALFLEHQTFNGLFIYKNSVIISITDTKYDDQKENSFKSTDQGNNETNYTIVIPAETKTLIFPSTLLFAGYPRKAIQELYDENKQKDLRNEYGNATLSMIDNISIDIYKRNNSPISILGFELSRKWFPIALIGVITIISFLLFYTIKNLRLSRVNLNTQEKSDDVLSFLMTNKLIRLFFWIVASPLIFFLVFSSSPVNYSKVIFYSLLFCCVLSTTLGIISYLWSFKM